MNKVLSIVFGFLFALGTANASTVGGTILNSSNVVQANGTVMFTITGCPVNQMTGPVSPVVGSYTFTANTQGVWSGTVVGNDLIKCPGNGSTQWKVSQFTSTGALISSGLFSLVNAAAFNPSTASSTVVAGQGSLTNPIVSQGDLIIGGLGGVPTKLPVGADGTTLLSDGVKPYWGIGAVGQQGPPGPPGAGITALTADVTAGGSGSVPATLATVNSSPGACGDSTHYCVPTTDGKGRVISQTSVAITGVSAIPHFSTALANVKKGTANARACLVADSETWGYLSNNTVGGGTNGNVYSLSVSLAKTLSTTYGIPAQQQGWMGDGAQTFVYGRYDANDARIVKGASFNQDLSVQSMGIATIAGTTSTAPFAYTPANPDGTGYPVDTFELYYVIDTTEGTGSANIDGGSATSFTATGSANVGKLILTAGSAGTHTLNVSRTTGTIHIIGMIAYNSTAPKAILIINAGSGGASSASWATTTKPYSPASSAIYAAIGCDLTIDANGATDAIGGVSGATFTTNTTALIAAQKTAGSDVALVSLTPQNTTYVSAANQLTIRNATQALAAVTSNNGTSLPLPYIDLTSAYISNANAVAVGLIQPTAIDSTNTHQTAAGYAYWAKLDASLIATGSVQNDYTSSNGQTSYNPYTNTQQSFIPYIAANPIGIQGNSGGFAVNVYYGASGSLDWLTGEEYGNQWNVCSNPGSTNYCPLKIANTAANSTIVEDATGVRFGASTATGLFESVGEGVSVTAASTITPLNHVFHLTGTTTVNVMTPPTAWASLGSQGYTGSIDFIADAATPFAAGTSTGSFKLAFTTVAGYPYRCTFSPSTGLWYCIVSGAAGGGGGAGSVTAVTGQHANGFNVVVSNGTTTPAISVTADATIDAGTDIVAAVSVCASASSTILVTQVITLNQDLTSPSNCTIQFSAAGKIVMGAGHTMTISGQVIAPVNNWIFDATTNGGAFAGLVQHNVSPLWFGVPNDCLHGSGTCTDGITQWESAIRALANSPTSAAAGGGQFYCPAGGYAFTGPLNFQFNGTGMVGPDTSTQSHSMCELWNKSASSVTINNASLDTGGTGTNPLSSGNTFKNLLLGRLLAPTTGSIGFRGYYDSGSVLDNVVSLDSLTHFWTNFSANGNRVQGWNNLGGYWANSMSAPGITSASYTVGTAAECLLVDAATTGEFSVRFNVADCNDGTHGSGHDLVSWTALLQSNGDMSDVYLDHTQAADTTGGILIDCTNATGADDIQIRDSILQSGIGVKVLNCSSSINTAIAVSGGWIGAAVNPIDIESSNGVSVSDVSIVGSGISQINNSKNIALIGNRDIGGGGFNITNTTVSRFIGNSVTMTGVTTGFNFVSSSNNTFAGNNTPDAVSGTGGHGVAFDSSSSGNTAIELNQFDHSDVNDGGFVTNHFNVAANNITNPTGDWNMNFAGHTFNWDFTGSGNGLNFYNTNSDTNTNPLINIISRSARSPIRIQQASANGYQTNSLTTNPNDSSMLMDNGFGSTVNLSSRPCYGGNAGTWYADHDGKLGWCDGGTMHSVNPFNSSLSDNGTTVSTSEPIAMGSGSTVNGSTICTTTTGCGGSGIQWRITPGTYNSILAFGTSRTVGADASTFATTAYVPLMATDLGITSITNNAVGGSQTADVVTTIFNDANPGATSTALQIMDAGINEVGNLLAGIPPYPYEQTFSNIWMAGASWLAVPSTLKTLGTAITPAANWSHETLYTQAPGLTTSTYLASQVINYTTTVENQQVLIWYQCKTADLGTFIVTDSANASATSIPTSPYPSPIGQSVSNAPCVFASVVPNRAAGSYTLTFVDSSSSGSVHILGIGVTPPTLVYGQTPTVWANNVGRMLFNQRQQIHDTINRDIGNNVAFLRGIGLAVEIVNLDDFTDGDAGNGAGANPEFWDGTGTSPTHCNQPPDTAAYWIHGCDAWHRKVANAFEAQNYAPTYTPPQQPGPAYGNTGSLEAMNIGDQIPSFFEGSQQFQLEWPGAPTTYYQNYGFDSPSGGVLRFTDRTYGGSNYFDTRSEQSDGTATLGATTANTQSPVIVAKNLGNGATPSVGAFTVVAGNLNGTIPSMPVPYLNSGGCFLGFNFSSGYSEHDLFCDPGVGGLGGFRIYNGNTLIGSWDQNGNYTVPGTVTSAGNTVLTTAHLPVMTWTGAVNWTVPTGSGTIGVMFFHTKSAITVTNLDIVATTQANCTGTQSVEIWDQTASAGGIPQALTNGNSTFSTSGTLNIAAGHNVYLITTAGATCAVAPVINATVQYIMQ